MSEPLMFHPRMIAAGLIMSIGPSIIGVTFALLSRHLLRC